MIIMLNPSIQSFIGMEHQRPPDPLEMQSEVSYLVRLEYRQIARTGFQHNPWFMQTQLPTYALLKNEQCTEMLVPKVLMSSGRDVEVENES